ncbi:MAG: transcriptional regulator [Bacteroidota bacterium]|jgi:DNA-binding MarR family transcriptional regulator|nr:transcriptional regulator [Bacteroidota bacterium]
MPVTKEFSVINDIDTDYEKVLASVYYTHFWLSDKYTAMFLEYDLSPQQSNVLGSVLFSHPKPLTLTELKSLMLEKNSDVSRIVSRLITKGYLEKKSNKENKRKIEITITQKGIDLMEKIRSQQLFKKFTAGLTTQEAQQLVNLLAKLRVD